MTELIPMVKRKVDVPHEGPFDREFSTIYRPIVRDRVIAASQVVGNFGQKLAFFEQNDPLREIFKILFRKDSLQHRSTSCVQISKLADRKCSIVVQLLIIT